MDLIKQQLLENSPCQLPEKKVTLGNGMSIATKRAGILQSKCTCQSGVPENEQHIDPPLCKLCLVTRSVPKLNGLPEMLFHDNYIRLENKNGAKIEFNPLDALKAIEETRDPLQVAVADGWQSARSDFPFANRVHKPYDWTYTSTYKGTVIGPAEDEIQDPTSPKFEVSATTETIDIEKLKRREDIIFYEDITLYEDELADHGVSKYSVKVRAMPSYVYILARFHLRIDNVLVRINDTRIYHEYRKKYSIREYTNREAKIKSLGLPLPVILDPNELMVHLPVIHNVVDKVTWP